MNHASMNRRSFLQTSALAGAAGLTGIHPLAAASKRKKRHIEYPKGKAEHCIYIWLGGGPAQIDTFDPKKRGDAKKRIAGSYYDSIKTAVDGVEVCEHLQQTANLLDRFTLLRTVNHDVIDEHAAATNRMHTGRPTSGTIVYPSIGSLISHERGGLTDTAPSYVVMGYPNATRGPGFLGAKHGYIYLTDTNSGPEGLSRPDYISTFRQNSREELLEKMRRHQIKRSGNDKLLADYDAAIEQSFKLTKGDFMRAFNLDEESSSLREAYGDEFGQRCLLARRLIQSGVRFQEVSFNLNFINGTGWDTHNDGQLKQHILIKQLDHALGTLINDLEKHKLLDKTLIVIAGEFGRPAEFDGGGGRGHQAKAFSVAMAGGGLSHKGAIGETDELSKNIVSRPVSVPDLFATMLCTLGVNPEKNLFDGDRPVPMTDMGDPVRELFG